MHGISPEDISRLFGRGLTLVDDDVVEQYWFGKNGIVSVTFGTKVGKVFATLFTWSLSGDGRLLLTFDKNIDQEWTSIAFEDGIVTVDTTAGQKKFSVHKATN